MATMTKSLGESVNAAEILLEDHRSLKALFRDFEAAEDDVKYTIACQAIDELELHDLIEEKCFYPALRKVADLDVLIKARAAHHSVRVMIRELKLMPEGRRFIAQFKLLADNVLAHMKEEEAVLIPAAQASLDMEEMGRDIAAIKYRRLLASVPERSGFGVGTLLIGGLVAAAAWALLAPNE